MYVCMQVYVYVDVQQHVNPILQVLGSIYRHMRLASIWNYLAYEIIS